MEDILSYTDSKDMNSFNCDRSLLSNHDNSYEDKLYNDLYNSKIKLVELPHKFQCNYCFKLPKIFLMNNDTLECECDCFHIFNMKSEIFLKYFCIEIRNGTNNKNMNFKLEEDNYCKCLEHSKKFVSYCTDCMCDICDECITKADRKNFTHTTLKFSDGFNKIKDEIQNKLDICSEERIKINKHFLFIIDIIIFYYINNPCYNNLKSLNNINDYLGELVKGVKKDSNLENKENKMEIYYKIKHSRDLISKITNHQEQINKIESIIIEKKNFCNLNLLTKVKEFNKLLILDLRSNYISNIKVLSQIKFPELKYLYLAINRLSDNSIEIIHNLYKTMPKVFELNFSRNCFTKYELLEGWENFKNLKILYLGINKLHPDYENVKDKKVIYDFSNIDDLGLSTGLFSEEAIKLLEKFNLKNIKTLYLNANNLNSFDFIDHLNCNNVKKLWLRSNNLTEFMPLTKFKKLKIINLSDNKIENIDGLNDFINEFPEIEKLNLENNRIERNNNDLDKQNNNEDKGAKEYINSKGKKIQILI